LSSFEFINHLNKGEGFEKLAEWLRKHDYKIEEI